MKKNFIMWILTLIVAFLGVVFAVVSFFKNKNFFWRSKDGDDDCEGFDENEEFDENLNDDVKNVEDGIVDVESYEADEKAVEGEDVDSFDYVDLNDYDDDSEINYDVD